MSYNCSLHCFDAEMADEKWTKDNLPAVKEYTDKELMDHDLWLGSTVAVSEVPDLYQYIDDLMRVHSIELGEYPTQQNIEDLLKNLDKVKVRSLLTSESAKYEPEIRNGLDSALWAINPFIANDDPADTIYSIQHMEKHLVPLFEQCGIPLYSSVTKQQLLDFVDCFDDEKYEQALQKMLASYNENLNEQENDLATILVGLKKIVAGINEKSSRIFVFSDDEGRHPSKIFQDRLGLIKTKL